MDGVIFEKDLDTGCIVPINRKLNKDGYYRVPHPTRLLKNGKKCRVMFHRLLWEQMNGKIPEGYSIHHKCHNRACCNIEHLELISISEHAKHHDSERYRDGQDNVTIQFCKTISGYRERITKAKEYWLQNHVTGTALASLFGVSVSHACRWVRKWKVEHV